MSDRPAWPVLGSPTFDATVATFHMWTQIAGKIRLERSPWVNHSWHVTLYVTPRGLTTGTIPYGDRTFELAFDVHDHRLRCLTSDGATREIALCSRPTAELHADLMATLDGLGLPVAIHGRPNEVDPAIPFAEDRTHATYEPADARALWGALVQADRVFREFRARFIGKCSPVHFFWGSFDLAVTRFSGRTAPEHPGGFPNMPDRITREAYSHEVSSAGFWPGGAAGPPIFYSYAYPSPEGFAEAAVRPAGASWSAELGEFVLPYETVRTADDPDATLLEFLESTYEAAAELASWDRAALERRFERRG